MPKSTRPLLRLSSVATRSATARPVVDAATQREAADAAVVAADDQIIRLRVAALAGFAAVGAEMPEFTAPAVAAEIARIAEVLQQHRTTITTAAKKAEVLFTDYIAEHLSANGRGGIIVPNGIVATTQTAYTKLRPFLVEDSLVAVVSLPAGVFNPYSGVKTSILFLDKGRSRQSEAVLFLKIAADGFDLGAGVHGQPGSTRPVCRRLPDTKSA